MFFFHFYLLMIILKVFAGSIAFQEKWLRLPTFAPNLAKSPGTNANIHHASFQHYIKKKILVTTYHA